MNRSLASWAFASSVAFCATSCQPTPDRNAHTSGAASALARIEHVRDRAHRDSGSPAFDVPRGRNLVARDGRIEASPSREAHAHVSLPASADRSFRVRDAAKGLSIEARLVGARPVAGEIADGVVVYPGAHSSGADVFHRITDEGTEDYLLLEGLTQVAYEVTLGEHVAAVRQVGPSVEFLDESGDPRLRMDPPVITDVNGKMHAAVATVSGCEVDTDPLAPWGRPHVAPGSRTCTVSLSWETLPYPALLDPAWNATGDMMQDRYGHGIVTLPSGLVLAVGGSRTFGGSGMALQSCEMFNPASGTWAAATNLPSYAFSATCYLVESNTKVFCWNEYDTSWMYTIAAPQWRATDPMLESNRQGAAHAQLSDGRILFVSGGNPLSVTAEIFDPAGSAGVGSYTATAFRPARPRAGGGAVTLADKRVIIAGGWNPTDSYMLQTEIYNATTDGFIAGADINQGLSNGTKGIRLLNDTVLMQGGFGNTEVYDPSGAGSWKSAPDTPSAGSGPGLLGFVGMNQLLNVHPTSASIFDAANNNWIPSVAPTPKSGSGGSTYVGSNAPLPGGRMLLCGGIDTTSNSASMKKTEIFNLSLAPLGGACTVNAECMSNSCANGVCCSTACNAGCQLCGATGMCGTAPAGTISAACGNYTCQGAATCPTTCATDSACVGSTYCASDNTCKPRHGQGSTCGTTDCKQGGCRYCASAGGCVDGYCCNSACNGSCDNCAVNFGVCSNVTGGGAPSCGNYVCSGASASCPTSCTGPSQCATTAFCNTSNQCEPKRAMGVGCTATSQCQGSLMCVDGVCCTGACTGQCQSCNRPGSLGMCMNVTGAPIGRAACNGSTGPCAGSCNGSASSCTYPTVSCRAASCTGGTATAPASCDGNGGCPVMATSACSPFACNDAMTACETSCTSDSDCASTHYCSGTSCLLRTAMDAGVDSGTVDAGVDSGTVDAGVDSGTAVDAGVDSGTTVDAGVDSGTTVDAGVDSGTTVDAAVDSGADAATIPMARPRPSTGLCSASPVTRGSGGRSLAFAAGLLSLVTLRRRRRVLSMLLPLLAITLVSGVASAQSSRTPRQARTAQPAATAQPAPAAGTAQPAGTAQAPQSREEVARAHFQLGSALYQEGRFEQAAHEFEQAYETSQRAALLYNVYVAYRDAQMLEESLVALRRYVALAPESETALLRSRLVSLEAQVAEVRRLRTTQTAGTATTSESTPAATPVATVPVPPPAAAERPSTGHPGRGKRIAGFALIGLAGAGVATFAGSLIGLKNARNDLNAYCGASVGLPDDQCQDVPQVDSAESRIGTFRGLGWASLGVSVAAAAAGTTLLLLGRHKDQPSTVSFACDITGCAGVVRGRF